MKFFLQKAVFKNRAPFQNLIMNFSENDVSLISSENGKGKTTILSHIADAFFEMAKPFYTNEFEGKENKFYRVSSLIFNLDQGQPSFVYFRFKASDQVIDYVDIRNQCSESQYNEAIPLENKIPFNKLEPHLKEKNFIKSFSNNLTEKIVNTVFLNNLISYFPSYRYEVPGYLNDTYRISLNFENRARYSGFLPNPIEITSGLSVLANWVMDVVLDIRANNRGPESLLFQHLNSIISKTLISKGKGELRFGIGPRGQGGTRIQILENKENGFQIYPTIFNLSSGESSLLCLFGELLRQADNFKTNIQTKDITGIVLVDEIDKHLHIKLQKEALPKLLEIFPNVQFILTSHSPFVSLGVAEVSPQRSKQICLETGLSIQPFNDPQYQEVYSMIIQENQNFKKLYEGIISQIEESRALQVITEGKNNEHISTAIAVIERSLLEKVKIISGSEDRSGDQQLKNTFDIMANAKHTGKFLFVWDCDSASKADSVNETANFFKFSFQKDEANSKAKKGIENLYDERFFSDEVYDRKTVEIDYGGEKIEKVFNKSKFLEKIKRETDKEIFKRFLPLIEKIKAILSVTT